MACILLLLSGQIVRLQAAGRKPTTSAAFKKIYLMGESTLNIKIYKSVCMG